MADLQAFVASKDAYVEKHDEATFNDLLHFYNSVNWRFTHEGVGGAMITAIRQ